ncbi:MAG: CDP-alcohol phosphatidyltransferase family protein [Bacteroidota bacterium]|nr:CDP-alcohol phosphatidyltransferase family protein [Bacteroidota bacterium]MDE2955552.1 CDP-alcohol phosphatidyltransferase family protein [Bacteroidota bacterium]
MRFVPNVISALRIAITPVVVLCLLQDAAWARLFACLFFLIGAGSDYVDGVVARLMHAQSRLGRFLDPLADKVLVLGTFCGLAWVYPATIPWWAVALIALRDISVTGLRMRAESRGRSVRTWRVAKSKTALQLIFLAAALLLRLGEIGTGRIGEWSTRVLDGTGLFWILMAVVAVTLVTGLGYMIRTEYEAS